VAKNVAKNYIGNISRARFGIFYSKSSILKVGMSKESINDGYCSKEPCLQSYIQKTTMVYLVAKLRRLCPI